MSDNVETNEALESALKKSDKLQVFPAAAARIQAVVDQPDSSLGDLEKAVSLDPTLSAQILKVANSPFFGMNRAVASLRQALFVLGFDATRDMALGLAVMSLGTSDRPLRRELWWHSVRTAAATQLITQRSRLQYEKSEAFVAGLLHDFGKLVLLEIKETTYLPLLKGLFHTAGERLRKAEIEAFGFDHAELGFTCLKRWNLPERTCERVRYHHRPLEAPEEVAGRAATIYLANQIDHRLGLKEPEDFVANELGDDPTAQSIGVDAAIITDVLNSLEEQTDAIQMLAG